MGIQSIMGIKTFILLIIAINFLAGESSATLESALTSIRDVAIGMSSAGSLAGERGGEVKVSSKMDKAIAFGKKIEDTDDDKKEATIKGVSDGMGKLVKGIQTSSWQDIVVGGLDIISTLTGLIDNPKFAILTSVLNILSTVFGLFGGSTGGEESTEGMMSRVIEKALLEAKTDELRAEFFGIKRLYGSLSNSIRAFRNAQNVSGDQANEFYIHAFSGVEFFGILEHYIQKWCDVGDATKHKDDAKKKQEFIEKTNRCLEFCNTYADLSLLRQILLADMASLLGALTQEDTAKTLLMLLSQEQESDRKLFRFLAEPINYKNQRYVAAYFYAYNERYPTLNAYLSKLDKDTENDTRRFIPPSIMICDENVLGGGCFSYTGEANISMFYAWNDNIKSFYISAGRKIYGYEHIDFEGVQYGPFFGPGVFGKLPSSTHWSSANILNSTLEATKILRICESENLDVNGDCAMLANERYPSLDTPFIDKRDDSASGPSWTNRIKSASIPAGKKLTAYTDIEFGGEEAGPYYGPLVLNKVCGGASEGEEKETKPNWASLKIDPTDLVSTQMVQICRGKSLTELCDHIESPTQIGRTVALENIEGESYHGCLWNGDKRINSVKVPGGLKVELFSKKSFRGRKFGPYTGPITVHEIDGSISNVEYIKSIRIKKFY